jgi:hypothetical protein
VSVEKRLDVLCDSLVTAIVTLKEGPNVRQTRRDLVKAHWVALDAVMGELPPERVTAYLRIGKRGKT